MPTLSTKKKGDIGEEVAKKYLKRKNYKILGQNIRLGKSEIDIIASIKGKLIFIEVKTCYFAKNKNIEFAVNEKKYQQLLLGISRYLAQNQDYNNYQLDLVVVEINPNNKKANIRHYPEIF